MKNYLPHQVGYYMSRCPIAVSPENSLIDACRIMTKNRISCVVVRKGNKPVGVLSERSIVRWFTNTKKVNSLVKEAMRNPAVCIEPQKTVMESLSLIRENHIRRLVITQKGEIVGLVTQSDLLEATVRLLSQTEAKKEEYKTIAQKDSLTALFSRNYFETVFRRELEKVKRYGGLLSVVIFDLDNFKEINDTLGHSAGDKTLEKVGKIIDSFSRGADVVARYGGDEFIVLLPGVGTRGTKVYAERVRKKIEEYFQEKPVKLTISAGICKWTPKTNTARRMVEKAGRLLYTAKKRGKNRVQVGNGV